VFRSFMWLLTPGGRDGVLWGCRRSHRRREEAEGDDREGERKFREHSWVMCRLFVLLKVVGRVGSGSCLADEGNLPLVAVLFIPTVAPALPESRYF
jgi:hypothetical protein